jgi:hypothetical protein
VIQPGAQHGGDAGDGLLVDGRAVGRGRKSMADDSSATRRRLGELRATSHTPTMMAAMPAIRLGGDFDSPKRPPGGEGVEHASRSDSIG